MITNDQLPTEAAIVGNAMLPAVLREILQSNYWEHFKFAKELSLYLEPNHPKRLRVENEMTKMLSILNSR